MLNNIIELADNKLLILYIIKKLKHPYSNAYITDIILNNNFMNYFLLQQYLNDLVENNYLLIINSKNQEEILYKLAPRGKKILEMFQSRISQFKIDCFKNYMNSIDEKSKSITVDTSYSEDKNNSFKLNMNFNKSNKSILNITLPIYSKEQLNSIIKHCKEDPKQTYENILSSLQHKKNDT